MTSVSPNKKMVPSPPSSKTNRPTFAQTAPAASMATNNNNNNNTTTTTATKKFTTNKGPEYLRHAEAQARALEKWTKQQSDWSHVSKNVAEKAHKSESSALSATTHLFREKVEETGKLDTAVPPAARSHASNSWEMGLRNGMSATRYEPVGSSYPYPLYCPIRSSDQVSADHPSLAHILYPPEVTQKVNKQDVHSKPVMESQFFKGRQSEFASHINKKFAHFQSAEYFDVRGVPAPRTNVPPADEQNPSQQPQSAVQFIPMETKEGETSMDPTGAATHAITIRNLIAQQALAQTNALSNNTSLAQPEKDSFGNNTSFALNNNNNSKQQGKDSSNSAQQQSNNHGVPPLANVASGNKQGAQQQTLGPQVVLSTNNLSFTTSNADEVKQAIITLDNTGSTAIYYQWAALPSAPAVLVNGLPGGITTSSTEQQQQDASGNNTNESGLSSASQQQQQANNNLTPSSQMASPFSLANPVTGSILPESMKMFCFSFRAKAPGIYTQHMELITVPSGRERIVVTLRGVALAPTADPVVCDSIEADLNRKCQATLAEEILRGDIIHNVRENVFDVSNAAAAVRQRESEIQAELDAPMKLREERKKMWIKANKKHSHSSIFTPSSIVPAEADTTAEAQPASSSAFPSSAGKNRNEIKPILPFCESAYAALETIRSRCNEFRSEYESNLQPSKSKLRQQAALLEAHKKGSKDANTPRGKKGDDDDSEPPPDRNVQLVGAVPEKWNGSLRSLYEDVSTLRTTKARNTATAAVTAIHRALEATKTYQNNNSNNSSSENSSVNTSTASSSNDQSLSTSSDSSPSLDGTSLSDIIWLSAGRAWLGNAFDKFERTILLANSRIENRAICTSKGINAYGVQSKKGGPGGGGGAGGGDRASTPVHALGADLNGPTASNTLAGGIGAASTRKGPGNQKQDAAAIAAANAAAQQSAKASSLLSSEELAYETKELKEQSVKQLLIGSIMGMISSHERDMETVEAATCLPLSSLIVDDCEQVLEHRDLDAEPQADTDKKKRK